MAKKLIVFLLIVSNFHVFAQQTSPIFKTNIEILKRQNNYTEFIYVHLDEFAKKPSIERLSIFKDLELNIWRSPENKKEYTSQLYFYINYAYQLKQFGFINESVNYYEKAYLVYKSNKINYDIIEFCLKPLANNYTRLGDSTRAEDILKITIKKAQEENRLDQIISGYTNLAVVYRIRGEVLSGIDYLNLALKLSSNDEVKSKINSDLAINYLLLEDFRKAEEMAILSNKLNSRKAYPVSIRNSVTIGNCFIHKNKLESALLEFENALKSAKTFFGENNREVAKIYNQIAEVYRLQTKYEKALNFNQKSLITLLPNYHPKSIFENPSTTFFYPENTLKETFDGRALLLTEIKKLERAVENYELSFLVETELRNVYTSQNSKLLQQQENRNRSENCIELCLLLFEQTGDLGWIEKAFQFSEQTKSIILLENKELTFAKSSIKNDSLLIIEKELQYNKAQLNKSIVLEQLKSDNANLNLLTKLTKDRETVFNKLQIIGQQISMKYPNLKSGNNGFISLSDIKINLLKNDELLIEFFEGKNNIYLFSIDKLNPISFVRIEKNEAFEEQVINFLKLFSEERGASIKNDVKNYTSLGFKLFEKLFQREFLKNTIIIPDGLFSFLPFDALVTEKTETTNFEKIPYLINKTNISYGYSASIMISDSKRISKNDDSFIGFFPVFKNNQRNLAELNYTEFEAKSIENEIDGEFLISEDASKDKFEKINNQYDFIHLSTHATAGNNFAPAAIEFYDETLYLPEIYGYNLNSDLLVLSACETGIGALKKGEGAMSLARGFSYAGVKNLIVSLWKVNDKSTEKVISGFYKKYIKLGNKAEALRDSKLAYLNDKSISTINKSPYYWAGFIYIGDTNSSDKLNNYLSLFFIIVLILIGGYFSYKRINFGKKFSE